MKKYSVDEFLDLYNNSESLDFKEYIVQEYVPFQNKVEVATKIIELCGLSVDDPNRLNSDSVSAYLFNTLNKIELFTSIKINWHNAVEEYNLLQEKGLITRLLQKVKMEELSEYDKIVNLARSDFEKNHYSTIPFMNDIVDKLMKELTPFLDKLWSEISNNISAPDLSTAGDKENE